MIALFISPHSKKIGESYIFPRLLREAKGNTSLKLMLYNVAGEWDHLSESYNVINNPLGFIVRLAPNIERISPWLNYRIWLTFISISLIVSLPLIIIRLSSSHQRLVVISRMATSATGIVALLFKNAKNVKFVASMAGVPLLNKFRAKFWPHLYSNFALVVCPCATMVSYVAEMTRLPDTKFAVIPNPVLENNAHLAAKKAIKTRQYEKDINHKWRLLTVGRLTRQKGLDVLIKSLSFIDNSIDLTIIGEGEDENMLKALCKATGNNDIVTFSGFVENPFKLAKDYDIFIMPSRWEGPGHTIIEALSSGLPSIVSNCPYGPEETVGFGKYGNVFRVDDLRNLAEVIDYTINTYSESKFSLQFGAKTLQKFEPKSVLMTWTKVLLDV